MIGYILTIAGLLTVCFIAWALAYVAVGFWVRDHKIILNLTNGRRKVIPATRFSVPTTAEMSRIEAETRTPGDPIGAFVHSWYRVKK